jgi:type IV pilus assembly protein PilV
MTMTRSRGFSLIEVLISIVILAVALLGTAGLMASSLKNTNTAYYRSQATVLADDVLDRMRANIPAARAGNYDVQEGPAYAAASGSFARFDCEEWIANLAETLPGGRGTVDVDGNFVATIIILWGDGETAESFRTQSRL